MTDLEELEQYREAIKSMEDCLRIQLSNGNWNYDQYMQGMANGMILFHSFFTGGDSPEFMDAPDVWIKDVHDPSLPMETTSE